MLEQEAQQDPLDEACNGVAQRKQDAHRSVRTAQRWVKRKPGGLQVLG